MAAESFGALPMKRIAFLCYTNQMQCHVLQKFTLGRLQPLLFADVRFPCRRNRNPDPKRRRPKVHPTETGEKTNLPLQ